MNAYIHHKDNSHNKHNQNNEYIDRINDSNSQNTSDMISSNEELNEKLCDSIDNQTEVIGSGLQSIANEIDNLSYNVKKVDNTLKWGFTETLLQLGHLNDNLDELKLIMRSPSLTWAYEKYIDSKVAFSNGWHDKALKHINYAIEGHGSNTGYDMEFRFHYLKGLILLGNKLNNDKSIISYKKAEKSFKEAIRFSLKDYPDDTPSIYLCAGRSASLQNNMEKTLEYTNKAISLKKGFKEAYKQNTKILYRFNKYDKANLILEKIFKEDFCYGLNFINNDNDLNAHTLEVNKVIQSINKGLIEDIKKNNKLIKKYINLHEESIPHLKIIIIDKLNGSIEELKRISKK